MTQPRLLGGRYRLAETIGLGGMAEVFRGTDLRLGRDVAIKVLRADLARDPSFHSRFRREAQSAASLNAPSIVSVYDTGEEGTPGQGPDSTMRVPYIVMEYVEGLTLRALLQAEGRLEARRALGITADVLSALDVAHSSGIVHRDIKPANVMLTLTGEVKVMDFGIARAVADTSSTMTQTAAVIGTAAYLSPEQARGEHVDARSDVYSAGCLLYELVTGAPPFTGDSPVAVAYQHVREAPVPPSELDPSLSPDVDTVVLTAMAKSPADRYPSAAAMRDDLLRAASDEPVQAAALPVRPGSAVLATQTVLGPVPSRRGRRVLVYGLFSLVLLAVVVGVALLVKSVLGGGAQLVPAPALVGLSRETAVARLTDVGLRLGHETQRFDPRPVGTVIAQSPDPRIVVRAGGGVDVVLSRGLETTVVPQVISRSQQEAQAILGDAKLEVATIVLRDGNTAPGTVLDVLPGPGTTVRAGSGVTLVVASGSLQVPDVRGRTADAAEAALAKAGFAVEQQPRDSRGKAGLVLDQEPVNQTAERGSTVVLGVSRRPRLRPTPSAAPTTRPPSATSSPSALPSPSATPSPSAVPPPSPTPSASPPASASPSPSPSPSVSPSSSPAASASATPTP